MKNIIVHEPGSSCIPATLDEIGMLPRTPDSFALWIMNLLSGRVWCCSLTIWTKGDACVALNRL